MPAFQVIVNPVAGKGAGLAQTEPVRTLLKSHQLDFDLIRTEGPGHAIELARQASLDGCPVVVAVGGDGTSNEVINGLMQAKEKGGGAAMGAIGVGTGNDFAYAAHIPAGIEAACQCLVQGHRGWIDVGRVRGGEWPQGRYFGNGVGIGFDVVATLEVQKIKRITGTPAFFLAVLKTLLLYYKAPLMTLHLDDETLVQPLWMISIMNGRRFGGGFYVAPDALPDDGLFDLTMTRLTSRLVALRLIGMYLQGTQKKHWSVSSRQARQVTIDAENGLMSHADGEIFLQNGQHLELTLLPHRLEVICQPGGYA